MKKFYILSLALSLCASAYAQEEEATPVEVPGLTSEAVTVANASFNSGFEGWSHTSQWSYTDSSNRNLGYARISNDPLNAHEILKQTISGKGAGTYVLKVQYKFDRNSYRGSGHIGDACLYITDDINIDLTTDTPSTGYTVFSAPTGNNWTQGVAVYTTDGTAEELEIGFGSVTSVGKGQIECKDFEVTYYPTLDQEAVKASLGMEYTGTLIDDKYVMVTGVTIDTASKTVEDKTPFSLTATIAPTNFSSEKKGIIWTSSNEDTATVDESGIVTPNGAGTCYIIASSAADQLVSGKCELTVEVPEVKVTGVTVAVEGDDAEAKVEETKNIQLVAHVAPDDATTKTVTWSSSDDKIATIDEHGVVTGVKSGSVTITATSDMVETVKGTIDLIVFKNAVTDITLSESVANIEQGKTLKLTATVAPDNATYPEVTWASSNESVATVDEAGLVHGIKAGEADITATADGVTSTCKITVLFIDVESVTLNSEEEKMVVGAEFTLHATVNPSNATDPKVTWTTSNANIATVSEGVVTGTGVGTVTIAAKAGEKTATCTFEIVPAVKVTTEVLSNAVTNPVFGASTWNEGWTTGSGWAVRTESKDQVYGAKTYARLYSGTLSPGTDGDFITQTITLPQAGLYSVTAYARASQNHSGALTDDQFGLLFINDAIPSEYDGLNCYKVRTAGWEWVQQGAVFTTSEDNEEVVIGYGLPKECPSIHNGNLECSDFVITYYPSTLDEDAAFAHVNKLIYTAVDEIKFGKNAYTVAEDSEGTIPVTVLPTDATNSKLLWESSDPDTVAVDETGKISAKKKGTAIITATSAADAMKKAETLITVDVISGINELDSEEGEAVYYSIDGVRIAEPTRPGLYIRNGKKVIIK